MSKSQITDSDIVDVLLGQASSEVERAVQTAARTDADFAAAYDNWTQIVSAAKSEAQLAEATTQRVCENVMKRVRREQPPRTVRVPARSGFRAGRLLDLGWRRALAPLAAVVVVCLTGAVIVQVINHGDNLTQQERRVTYVDFTASAAEEGGNQDEPYGTLGEAVQAAPDGGTIVIRASAANASTSETVLIAKPLRLEAVGGKVRIGKM